MHKVSFAVGTGCVLAVICLTFGRDQASQSAQKESAPAKTADAPKKGAPAATKIAAPVAPDDATNADDLSPDEIAIHKETEAFVNAYCESNAKAAASHFTPNAEYVGPDGVVVQGREAIEASLSAFFTEHPDCDLEVTINSIRMVGPGVAIEDGSTTIHHLEEGEQAQTAYTAVHVKSGEKWLVASVRDRAPERKQSHEEQLAQLSWLQGNWIDEDEHSVVSFNCQPVDNGKFLLREFSLKIDGRDALSGSQRIGYDALTGQLVTWIFDSEGGHAQGTWHHHGDKWTLTSAGVTSDGEPASGMSIYTFVNEHTMTWQAVDHVVGGVHLPDSPVFTLVQKLPQPKQTQVTRD